MKAIKKVYLAMNTLCRLGLFFAFMVLIAAVLIQVTGRAIGVSPIWTEELTRFALIYLTAIGAGLGLMSGDLVNVDVVCDALPDPMPRYLRVLASLLTAFLSALLIPGAIRFVKVGVMQKSPALEISMNMVHLSVLVLLMLLLVFSLLRALLDLLSVEYQS